MYNEVLYNGIINIYKEKGFTSHDAVAKLRGILKMKRIGHTGTLDPEAEGVLPICLGKATKLADMLTDTDKTYDAVLKLGITTNTQDMTGHILKESEVKTGLSDLEAVINRYIGSYDQLPPMYSAIRVNGKRLYELARQGMEVERKTRRVQIRDIRIMSYSEVEHEARLIVDCSKGTYIRTLLHDIGEDLGCGGAMKSLVRVRAGSFTLSDALKLSDVQRLHMEGGLDKYIKPIEDMFPDYPCIYVSPEWDRIVHNGNLVKRSSIGSVEIPGSDGQQTGALLLNMAASGRVNLVKMYDSGESFIGIYKYDHASSGFKPVKMFI